MLNIGHKSVDGNLTIVGYAGKIKNGAKSYLVECKICSKDIELFPTLFNMSAYKFNSGEKPCGCARNPKWKKSQYLILARRKAKKSLDITGISEDFKGQLTRLKVLCLDCRHKWTPTANTIMNGSGCPKCAKEVSRIKRMKPEHLALSECVKICEDMDYTPPWI